MKKLEVINLSVKFGDKLIVKNVNLNVKEGELVSIIGISGSGKSTIFNAITSIIPIESGEILLNGNNITGKLGKVSYMLQKDLLLPFKNILDNISLPLIIKGYSKEEAYNEIDKYINIFGLEEQKLKYPKFLSGGQRQRAALLRTLMFSNEIHLLDEPFSALDLITKSNIHKWYDEIRKKLKLSTLLITHDIDEAILLSNRIYILKDGEIFKEININLKENRNNTDYDFINLKKEIVEYLN